MTGKVNPETLGDAMVPASVSSPTAKRAARGSRGSGGRGAGDTGRTPSSAGAALALARTASTGHHGERPRPLLPPKSREDYAINSAVFSAMALGALLLGQMPADVEQYAAVAEASLRLCGFGSREGAAEGAETGATDTENQAASVAPNEKLAVAHLLVAFSSNMAGRREYLTHIRLARECYEYRGRHNKPMPPAIGQTLRYRDIIDALGKPSTTRIPPARNAGDIDVASNMEKRVPSSSVPPPPSSPAAVEAVEVASPSSPIDGAPSIAVEGKIIGKRGAGERSGWGRAKNNGRISAWGGDGGNSSNVDGDNDGVRDAAESERAVVEAVAAAPAAGDGLHGDKANERGPAGERPGLPKAGLEAARERKRLRKADSLLMVSDIMTVLSKVPWSMKSEKVKRETSSQLSELRSLMVEEKALVEERRIARGRWVSLFCWCWC